MSPAAERWLRRGALTLSLTLAASVTATVVVVMWPRVIRAIGLTPPPPEPAYRTGQPADTPPEWTAGSPLTLVLFAQSACGACQKAQPFLRELFAELQGRARIIFASHGPSRAVELKFGEEMGLDQFAYRVTPRGLRVRATPTLLVIDATGKIVDAWEGIGPSAQQKIIWDKLLATNNLQRTTNK